MSWTAPMKASLAVFCMMLSVWLFVIGALFWPVKVFEFKTPLTIMGEAKAGEVMHYRMDIAKYRAVPGEVTKQLIAPRRIITLESIISNAPVGSRTTIGRTFIYPDVPPGRYTFRWTAVFRINAIRYITITQESPWFDVLPARK